MRLMAWKVEGRAFHFGQRGLGLEESGLTLPSDSLFAALTARLADSFSDELAVWNEAIQNGKPLVVFGSALPCLGKVRFFPRPLRLHRADQKQAGKAIKRLRFVSEKLFGALIGGASLASLEANALKLQGGLAWMDRDEVAALPGGAGLPEERRFWAIAQRPRVTIDRVRNSSNLFHVGEVTFAPGCGLWFPMLWQTQDEAQQQIVQEALLELVEGGLGGERSVGLGQARLLELPTLELPEVGPGGWMTLGRYLPQADEMPALQDERSVYTLQTVGGWLLSPQAKSQRRRTVQMLAEGACLAGPLPRPIPGQVADVRPNYAGMTAVEHPVWRCGLALPVGLSE